MLVFFQYVFNCLFTHVCLLNLLYQIHSSLFLLSYCDFWWLLVESYSKTLKLFFNNDLMHGRSCCIKNYENQIACSSHCNNGSSSSLVVLGSLNYSWKIQELYFGPIQLEHSWNTGHCCELPLCHLGLCASDLVKKG